MNLVVYDISYGCYLVSSNFSFYSNLEEKKYFD